MENDKEVLSFAIGDVVTFKEPYTKHSRRPEQTSTGLWVITKTEVCQGKLEYGVNDWSWYDQSLLELEYRADFMSLALALSFESEDDEEETLED